MKPKPLIIPKSKLGQQLEETAAIKREMTELLRRLEERATGHQISQPGGWRHDPLGWQESHHSKSHKQPN